MVMCRLLLPVLICLSTLLIAGCAGVTKPQPTTSVASPPTKSAASKPKTASPDWKTDRKTWCRMREQQKAARKSADQSIASTTDPYLISVHDEMCRAQ